MASRDDYHALLARAVAGLDRDSYAARGAIYDREHKALLRRLFAADSDLSDAEIDREQQAFREAIRLIEFGDESETFPLAPYRVVQHEPVHHDPQPEAAPPPIPAHAYERERSVSQEPSVSPPPPPLEPMRSPLDAWEPRHPAGEAAPSHAAVMERNGHAPADTKGTPRRRSVVGRVIGRTLIALLLIIVGVIAYGYSTGQLKLPWLTGIVGQRPTPTSPVVASTERAILFDGNISEAAEDQIVGKAVWQSTFDSGRPDGPPVAVLNLQATVPQRNLILNVTMRPEAPGGAMSHLFEIRFLLPNRRPDDAITEIGGLATRSGDAADSSGLLVGSVAKVAAGVFLFGLAANPASREMNLRRLRNMRWLDIRLGYTNGARGVLSIEKAGKGEQVVNDVLAKWEG